MEVINQIILVEDNPDHVSVIEGHVSKIDSRPDMLLVCNSLHKLDGVDPAVIDIVLMSYTLNGTTFPNAFQKIRKTFPNCPIIVLVDQEHPSTATKIAGQGAEDYLVRGQFDEKLLEKSIFYALKYKKFSTDYKRLFDENPGPMYIYEHATYRFLGVNDAALSQYGYNKDEFLNMNAKQIRPSDTVSAFEETNDQKPEAYFDYGRWQHMGKDGEVFYVHIYAHTIEFEGKIARLVFAANINKKVLAERALERQNEQLRQIAWINSHEVRGPVASILGLVQLFNKESLADPMNAEIIEKLLDATNKLDEVIKKIDYHAMNSDLNISNS